MKIGVIGLGVVGGSIYKVLKDFHPDVKGYDVDPEKSINKLSEIFEADVVFLALPTPLGSEGRLNVSLLTEYLQNLKQITTRGSLS